MFPQSSPAFCLCALQRPSMVIDVADLVSDRPFRGLSFIFSRRTFFRKRVAAGRTRFHIDNYRGNNGIVRSLPEWKKFTNFSPGQMPRHGRPVNRSLTQLQNQTGGLQSTHRDPRARQRFYPFRGIRIKFDLWAVAGAWSGKKVLGVTPDDLWLVDRSCFRYSSNQKAGAQLDPGQPGLTYLPRRT